MVAVDKIVTEKSGGKVPAGFGSQEIAIPRASFFSGEMIACPSGKETTGLNKASAKGSEGKTDTGLAHGMSFFLQPFLFPTH